MKIPSLVALAATALLTLSACGSGGSSTSAQPPTGQKGATATGVAETSLGKVLVDGQGMTLYTLSADGHEHSTCTTDCLQFWPAVSPGDTHPVSAPTGHTAAPDGTAVATVAGHPVYTFSLDHQPGDVNGEGVTEFGGTWYAVSPTGEPVMGGSSSPSSGSSSGSSSGTTGGYGY